MESKAERKCELQKLRRTVLKHYNCLPWFIVGVLVLTDEKITKLDYFLCWISVLGLLWVFCPDEKKIKEEDTN